jgi:hypothetical protein
VTVGSSSQAASRSLPETSALLPREMNELMPRPSSRARSRNAIPTPPDCDATASPPGGGTLRVKVALRRTAGSLTITPRQLGPISRMSCSRAVRRTRCCILAPSAPSSPKPDEMTTTAEMLARAASRTTASTWRAGTATIATSTCFGTSVRWRTAGTPSTEPTSGCTTCTSPVKPPSRIEVSTARPRPDPSRRTPTTATVRGCSRGASDLASEARSRRSATSTAAAVASVLISTRRTPWSLRCVWVNPAPRNRVSIAWLAGSTSATSRRTPTSRQAAARCSRSRLPNPCRCSASATRKAASATSGPIRSATAVATMVPPTVATSVATVSPEPVIRWST